MSHMGSIKEGEHEAIIPPPEQGDGVQALINNLKPTEAAIKPDAKSTHRIC
ncbi:MAG: hypothetical protein U1E36_02340 [Rickettsiales bacterium]